MVRTIVYQALTDDNPIGLASTDMDYLVRMVEGWVKRYCRRHCEEGEPSPALLSRELEGSIMTLKFSNFGVVEIHPLTVVDPVG